MTFNFNFSKFFAKFFEEAKNIGRGFSKLRSFKFAYLGEVISRFSRREAITLLTLLVVLLTSLIIDGSRFYLHHTMVVPAYGGTYTEGLVGGPRYINPILAQSQTDKDLSRLVFAGLYKFDNHGKMVPDLATSDLDISADGKSYTVHLRQNLKWHDGQSLNADDVIFTVQTLQNPDFKSPYRNLWLNIQVQKIDDTTIKFSNPNVAAPFITNLTLGILPKHIWQNISASDFPLSKYNLEPVGSGPYLAKEINKLANGTISSISLESYSNYWAGKPNIDTVNLKFYNNYQDMLMALHTKDIQNLGFIPFDSKLYVDEKHTNENILKIPVYEYQALFFNLSKSSKVLGDRNVRVALAESLDRGNFINSVYSGLALPAYGPIMPEQIGYNSTIEDANSFDVAAANSLLDKAGWTIDPTTGFRSNGKNQLAFTITTNDFILNSKSADELQSEWKKIGANVTINIVNGNDIEKNNIRPRNYDALLFSESTGFDPDPFVFWHSSQSQDPGFNLAQYKNITADRLISDARNTFNTETRIDKYKQFQTLMSVDLPALFLTQSEFIYELNPQVKGTDIAQLANPEDRFYDISHWYIQTKRVWK